MKFNFYKITLYIIYLISLLFVSCTKDNPLFNPDNVPLIYLETNLILSINDSIVLQPTIIDENATSLTYEWNANGGGYVYTSKPDTLIFAPSSPDSAFVCSLRVTDNDGNSSYVGVSINVLLDQPTLTAITESEEVTMNNNVYLSGLVEDEYGTIVKYEWNINNNEYVQTSGIDTTFKAFASEYICSLKVTDDDGNVVLSSIDIDIVNYKIISVVTSDLIEVSINDSILLKNSISSPNSVDSIVKWEWDVGNTGSFIVTSDSTYLTMVSSTPDSNYLCISRVTDDDGNVGLDTVTINVLLDAPICTVTTTTPFVSTNDTIKLKGSITNEYGNIEKYEWKFGNDEWIVSSTIDTVIFAPSSELFYVCSLKVTDDDGLIDVISIEIVVGTPTFEDIDGNVYNTVIIGSQIWFKENLRTTKYNDGTPIPNLKNDSDWINATIGAHCFYDNTTDQDSIIKNGALYNWYAVNTGKLAPTGWHVATDDDWNILAHYLIDNGYNWGGETTGNMLGKSIATKEGWYPYINDGAVGNDPSTNNSSGFSGVPAGARGSELYGMSRFVDKGSYAFWWMVDSKTTAARSYYITYYQPYFMLGRENKVEGHSIRLVRDSYLW